MYELCMTRTKIPAVKVCYKRTEKLKVLRTFPREIMSEPEIAKKLVTKDLAYGIAEELEKFVDIKTSIDPIMNQYVVEGNIEVVLQEIRNNKWWELDTCDACITPYIMYEPKMKACEDKR